MIRISFIGAGGICEQRHLPALQQIPDVELVAVCNRNAESSERIQQKWNFARSETDWRKVIDDPHVDAIFIGTWPYLHRELSIAALQAGKHVFCQARMCMDWNEAQQMVAVARAHPQFVSMVCPSPFRVRWERRVKQILAAPEFGALETVSVCSRNGANLNFERISWREKVEYSGLNILQVGIFAETLNSWCGEYAALTAATKIQLNPKIDAAGLRHEIQVPQAVEIQGMLACGAAITESHFGLWAGTEVSEIMLSGSDQVCRIDLLAGSVSLQRQRDSNEHAIDSSGDPWRVEQEFVSAVIDARRGDPWRSKDRINPDFDVAARYMSKMQAIHDSAATGRPVELKV